MGYANPRININKSLGVINQEVDKFNKQFDEEFGKLNDRNMENIQKNLEEAERQKARRLMGDQAWYETVEKFRPKGGYKEKNDALLRQLHDQYYELLGCDTKECVEQRNKLLQVPRNMSEQRGAYAGGLEVLNAASDINSLEPGSVDYMQTPAEYIDFYRNGDQYTPEYNAETGVITYTKYDENGEVVAQINGRDFVRGSLDGNIGVSTYGDPSALRKEIHQKEYDQLGIKNLGITEIDKTDPAYQTKIKDYTQARDVYTNAIKDDRLYDPILNKNSTMRSSYPVIINELVKRAQTGDEEAISALGPILGGEDGEFGKGDDDLEYGPQAAAGQWQNSDVQRRAALTYFKTDDPNENIMPALSYSPEGRELKTVNKDGLTAYQQTQVENQKRDDKRADRTLDLKEEQAALVANKNRNAAENTRLRKIEKILEIEKRDQEGKATDEDLKIRQQLVDEINASATDSKDDSQDTNTDDSQDANTDTDQDTKTDNQGVKTTIKLSGVDKNAVLDQAGKINIGDVIVYKDDKGKITRIKRISDTQVLINGKKKDLKKV